MLHYFNAVFISIRIDVLLLFHVYSLYDIINKRLTLVHWKARSGLPISTFSERELMFMFAICRRPSVCRLSVCNVRAPYSAD